jgi:choline dehydrogenase-like flavoprotein
MPSDARELTSDQQLYADVYIIGPGAAGISIARELSGNGASICLTRVRPGIRYSGWLFKSTQLDPRAHAQAVGGLRPFDYDARRSPDPALENRHLLRPSRRVHTHRCSHPTLPVVALAARLAYDLEKQLAD